MKKLIFITALLINTQAFAGYNLFCRGPLSISAGGMLTMFHFTKSSNFGNAHLNPGECTWGDRVISNDEPNFITVGNPAPLVLPMGQPLTPNVATQVGVNQLMNLLLNKNLIITLEVEKKPFPGGIGVSTYTFIPDQGVGANAIIKYEVNYSQI